MRNFSTDNKNLCKVKNEGPHPPCISAFIFFTSSLPYFMPVNMILKMGGQRNDSASNTRLGDCCTNT